MKITEALAAEHTILLGVFEQIERALPACTTPAEMKTLSSIVEGLLRQHAEIETHLAYAPLDHTLAQRSQLDGLYQDHHEIDARLSSVRTAATCAEARRLLQAALIAAREHFRAEERHAFPLLEKSLHNEVLAELGRAWLERRNEPPSAAP